MVGSQVRLKEETQEEKTSEIQNGIGTPEYIITRVMGSWNLAKDLAIAIGSSRWHPKSGLGSNLSLPQELTSRLRLWNRWPIRRLGTPDRT